MRIARVFPRKTKASPFDDLAFFGPPGIFPPEVDEIHVSVTFTYDMEYGEYLAHQWDRFGIPVKVGGPGAGTPGGEFIPGKYLRPGLVITSRGCGNRCWFCQVWKREGNIKELKIHPGNNILDDNFLQCSEEHQRKVFRMLKETNQKEIEFTGGLEAARLKDWHIEEFRKLPIKQLFFAYDTPDDLEPLRDAGRRLLAAGYTRTSHDLRAFVLLGFPGDTFDAAERRLMEAYHSGFYPMGMLYKNKKGFQSEDWISFNTDWANSFTINLKIKESKYYVGIKH